MFFRSIMAVITTVLIVIASYTFPGFAIDGTAKTQIPGVYPFELGDFTIVALSDGTVPQDLPKLLTHTNSAFPGVGHLRAEDQGYTWIPLDYRWRE